MFRRPTAVTAQIWRSHPVDVYIFVPACVGTGAKCGDPDPPLRSGNPALGTWELGVASSGESQGGDGTSRVGCPAGMLRRTAVRRCMTLGVHPVITKKGSDAGRPLRRCPTLGVHLVIGKRGSDAGRPLGRCLTLGVHPLITERGYDAGRPLGRCLTLGVHLVIRRI